MAITPIKQPYYLILIRLNYGCDSFSTKVKVLHSTAGIFYIGDWGRGDLHNANKAI